MAELYETLAGTPAPVRQGGSVEVQASKLGEFATRAVKRQQSLVDNRLTPNLSDVMNPKPALKTDKTGLGAPSGQPQGLPGITNTVSNAAVAGAGGPAGLNQDVLDFDAPPTARPDRLPEQPLDTQYASLSPVQRNSALRSTGLEAVDHAIDPQTKGVRKSASGATVLALKSDWGESGSLFLAEDGVAAHAALMKAARKAGLRAFPTNGDSEYEVGWVVHPSDRAKFNKMAQYLEAGNVSDSTDGRIKVVFTEQNSLNREFMRAPFGTKRKGGGR